MGLRRAAATEEARRPQLLQPRSTVGKIGNKNRPAFGGFILKS